MSWNNNLAGKNEVESELKSAICCSIFDIIFLQFFLQNDYFFLLFSILTHTDDATGLSNLPLISKSISKVID